MASKEYGRDPKAKLNLNKAHGEEAMQKSGMGDVLKESLEQMQDRDSKEKWLFGKKQIENTPSRRDNIPAEKELNYRQQAANLIQDMGQRLPVNQLTINTAIVYMHRFYMFHSFQAFSRFVMAPTALFLAAKVEEQPRKLEHVIKVCHSCLHPDKPHIDVHSDGYMKQAQDLVQNELIMLQTLGFDISIDHPHTHVVKCTQLVKASRDLSQMAYFMATNSLHLTTFCLQYNPTVVSAMCIHLSCKWSNYEIPLSSAGKAYWTYMDPTITESMLESIINEFLKILNLCPTRLRKLRNYKPSQHRDSSGGSVPSTSKDGQQGKPSSTSSSRASHGSRPSSSGQPQELPPAANPSANDLMKKHPSMTLAEYKKRDKTLVGKQPNMQEKEMKQEKQHTYNSPHGHPPHRKVPHQSHPASAMRPKNGNPNLEGQHSRHHNPPPGSQHPQNRVKPHPSTSEHNRSHDRAPQPLTQSVKQDKPAVGIPSLKRQPQASSTSHTMQKHNVQEHKTAREHSNASTSHHGSTGASHPRHHEPHIKAMQRSKDEQSQPQDHTTSNSPAANTAEVENAMMKGIEMKIMEQMKAEKSVVKSQAEDSSVSHSVPTSNIPGTKHHSQSSANHHTPHVTKEHRGRHSHPGHPIQEKLNPSTSHHSMSFSEVKSPGEQQQHKKNPHAMYIYLKQKMQNGPLSDEEKNLLHKLKKKEEERRRKREHKKQKSQQTQPSEQGGSAEGNSTPSGGGSLTVRIKLPPSSSKPVGSSSGSGSEAALMHSPGGTVLPKPGRKRAHGHDSSMDPTLVKQSRKSDTHHHQGQGSSQGNPSKHKHSRSSSHHHQSKAQQQSGQKIDNAVFQRALEDAVSLVQSGHTGSSNSGNGNASGRVVPTVTLKRTGAHNGSEDNYIAHSSKQEKRRSSSKRSKHSNFDPSTPVSATLPEDLFDQEDDDANHHHQNFDRKHASDDNGRNAANLSSPETGEIRDDEDESVSPLREHVASSLPASKDWSNFQRKRTANNVSPQYRHRNSASEFLPKGSDGYPIETKGRDRVPTLTIKSSYLNETR